MTKILIVRHGPVDGFFPERFSRAGRSAVDRRGAPSGRGDGVRSVGSDTQGNLARALLPNVEGQARQERPKATGTEPVITAV